jgi:NAD(P)-dependent dehydrogenase (short-subunit alcohol dehydrogenase family)
MKSYLFLLAALPVFIRLLQRGLHFALTPNYSVHTNGIVLISGTSTGIGYATVVDLAKATNYTIFAGVRREEDFDRFHQLGYANIVPVLLDVTSSASIDSALDAIQKYMLANDQLFVGLINNAGIAHAIAFEYYPLQAAREVFDVNVFGVMALTQRFLPLLRSSHGRIVFIGSIAGLTAFPLGSIYCASKHALEAVADSLRRELHSHQVAVSLMEPGFVKSVLMHSVHILSAKVIEKYQVSLEEAKEAYPKYFNEEFQTSRRQLQTGKAVEPSEVSTAILHALTSLQPFSRYRLANVAGIPAWLLSWLLWILPDCVLDFAYTF